VNAHYEIEGAGKPLVYLLPAFGQVTMRSFGPIAGHRTITIAPQVDEHPPSIERFAEQVTRVVQELGISKADFLGQSYGGAIATMIALRRPDLSEEFRAYLRSEISKAEKI